MDFFKIQWNLISRNFSKSFVLSATDLKVDGGYGAMSAEGLGESSAFAGTDYWKKMYIFHSVENKEFSYHSDFTWNQF